MSASCGHRMPGALSLFGSNERVSARGFGLCRMAPARVAELYRRVRHGIKFPARSTRLATLGRIFAGFRGECFARNPYIEY